MNGANWLLVFAKDVKILGGRIYNIEKQKF